MASRSGESASSGAVAWLREHPAVGETARKRIDSSDKAVPDAVLENPARLLEMLNESVIQALQSDAPVGVADELLLSLRILSARLERLERDSYLKAELGALQGLRDREEITTALQNSAAKAPDESRASLERMIRVANAVSVSDPLEGVPFILGPDHVSPGPQVPVDPGGVEPPVVEPPVVEPGSVDFGGRTGGTSTGAPDFGAQVGSAIGAEVGSALGIAGGADQGAALGSQFGTQFATQLGLGSGSGSPSGGGFFSGFFSMVGGAVGFALGGPAGGSIGAGLGARLGALVDQALVDDEVPDPTTTAACVLCGPDCVICVLAAEPGNAALLFLH